MDKYENTNMMLMEPRGGNAGLSAGNIRSKTEYMGAGGSGQQVIH